MSSRTYIGPFGRIPPLPEGSEPEQTSSYYADDERNSLQLPRPPLNFGSDTTLGFTDPTRYNTSNHSRRTHDPRVSESDHQRPSSRENLPPVRQLLTPGSQPSVPASPFSSQYSPASSHRQSSLASSRHSSIPAQGPESSYRPEGAYQYPPGASLGPPRLSVPSAGEFFPSGHTEQSSQAYISVDQVSPANFHSFGSTATQLPYQAQPTISQHHSLLPLSIPQLSTYQNQQNSILSQPAPYHPNNPDLYNFTPNAEASTSPHQHTSANIVQPGPRLISDGVTVQGPVWIYEDGSTCPKVIDGEPVNAEWGVTKAGKPRKRLAIACLSCREKKIKCDPAEPKCIQCEKNGRVCKFATA